MAKQSCVYFFFLSHLSQLISLISLFSSLSLSDISSSLCLLPSFPWEYNIPSLGILLELPLEYHISSLGILLEFPLGIPYPISWNTVGISLGNTMSYLLEYPWNTLGISSWNIISYPFKYSVSWEAFLRIKYLVFWHILGTSLGLPLELSLGIPWQFTGTTLGTSPRNIMSHLSLIFSAVHYISLLFSLSLKNVYLSLYHSHLLLSFNILFSFLANFVWSGINLVLCDWKQINHGNFEEK